MQDDATRVSVSKLWGLTMLPGAEMAIVDSSDNVVYTWTSGTNAELIVGVLKAGARINTINGIFQ